jgi:hypothetical protein
MNQQTGGDTHTCAEAGATLPTRLPMLPNCLQGNSRCSGSATASQQQRLSNSSGHTCDMLLAWLWSLTPVGCKAGQAVCCTGFRVHTPQNSLGYDTRGAFRCSSAGDVGFTKQAHYAELRHDPMSSMVVARLPHVLAGKLTQPGHTGACILTVRSAMLCIPARVCSCCIVHMWAKPVGQGTPRHAAPRAMCARVLLAPVYSRATATARHAADTTGHGFRDTYQKVVAAPSAYSLVSILVIAWLSAVHSLLSASAGS